MTKSWVFRREVVQRVSSLLQVNRHLRQWFGIEVRQYCDLAADLESLVGKDASVILDIGANNGQSAELFSRLFPQARIYAVEPFEPSYQALVRRRLPRVWPRHSAIGSSEGVAQLSVHSQSVTNSLLAPGPAGRAFFPTQTAPLSTVEVPITRLDSFVTAENLGDVDLLKIDVQGAELEVLAGGARALSRTRVVLVECNFVGLYRGSALFGYVDSSLRRSGFEFHNFYGLHQDPATRRFLFGDALYVARVSPLEDLVRATSE